MKLASVCVASLVSFAVAGCAAEPTDASGPEEGSESDYTSAGSPPQRVASLVALTPISQPTNGIFPRGESERRWARSGGRFTQGLWGGRDDDGRPCTVHVIHYEWRDGGKEAFIQAWLDDGVRYRRYDEDFDTNVSGIERGIVLAAKGPHRLSLTDDPSPGDDVGKFEARGDTMKLTAHMLIKNRDEDWRDVEVELSHFAKPGSGVVVRIKQFGADDVVLCHGLVPKKGPTD